MSAARRAALVAAIVFSAGPACVVRAQVYLRGRADPLSANVEAVGKDGVVVRGDKNGSGGAGVGGADPSGPAIVSWDLVRRVDGPHADDAKPFAAMADHLWRARTRLERGDIDQAEPLFEELARQFAGADGPTASVVFDGLCRCRVARGAQGAAVAAALDWLQARKSVWSSPGSPAWIGGQVHAASVLDESSGLIPSLPPVYAGDGAGGASLGVAALMDDQSRWTEPSVGDLAMLYRAAARFEAGLDPELRDLRSSAPGVRLVRDIVVARAGNQVQREESRKRLGEKLRDQDAEPWVQAWCRFGIGRSLLREDDADRKRDGLVQMLYVPACLAPVSPYLAGVAVGEAALWSNRMGDEKGAHALKVELGRAFPWHPANSWPGVIDIKEPKPDAKVTP